MIDEELYKLATDELNSDKRNPEVWARARALACGDHDEARFLYTNLRVEEMMSKGGKSKTFSAAEAKLNAQSLETDNAVNMSSAEKMDSLDLPEDMGNDSISSNRTGIDGSNEALPIDDFVEYESDVDPNFSSVSGNSQNANTNDTIADADLSQYSTDSAYSSVAGNDLNAQQNSDIELDFSEAAASLEAGNEAMQGSLSSLTGDLVESKDQLESLDPSQIAEYDSNKESNDLVARSPIMMDPLTGEVSELGSNTPISAARVHTTPETLKTRALSNELERQAKDLGSIDDHIGATVDYTEVPVESPEAAPIEFDHTNIEETTQVHYDTTSVDEAVPAQFESASLGDATAVDETANTGLWDKPPTEQPPFQLQEQDVAASSSEPVMHTEHETATSIQPEQPLAAAAATLPTQIDGFGRLYLMFNRRGVTKAIKTGVSWPALFFTLPWLLYKQLIGTAIVYTLLWVVAIVGLLATGFNWMDSGTDATLTTKLWFAGFALLGFIGLFLVPFLYGNSWAADKLHRRGFHLQSEVKARSKREAFNKLKQVHATGTF